MNRIDRLTAILVLLQSRSLLRAQQIAERFEISIRTVYRDIRALEEAGIPVIGNPGIGYSLMDGYKLPPLMFTPAEALSFLIAEMLINELADSASMLNYKSGIDKIRAVMRYADKEVLETIEENVCVPDFHKQHDYKSDILQTILQSIYQKKVLQITYLSDYTKESSLREVEAVGIFFSRANWYMTAFCRIRKDYRTFRLDRIQAVTALDIIATTKHPTLKKFLGDAQKTQELKEIIIRIPKDKEATIGDDKYYYGMTSRKEVENDFIELTFNSFSLDKFARWYLSFADMSIIVSPESLKENIRNIIKHISL